MASELTLGIVGSGGDGVILLGEVLAKASARSGLHTSLVKSFGPQIRGGETSARLHVGSGTVPALANQRPEAAATGDLDGLLLFGLGDLARFAGELPLGPGTEVIAEAGDESPLEQSALPEYLWAGVKRVPLEELATAHSQTKQAKNMVLAGVVTEYFGWPAEAVTEAIERRFARHGAATLGANLRALAAGRDFARDHLGRSPRALEFTPAAPLYFLSGNEAFSLGALSAGCRFMAGYPISPASEILEWMNRQLPRFGGTCIQAEDEIAAVCMAIGASFGGVRAMTATSGPGFSLKQEALGLAHMAEIPLVVCNVQRCGPSTGIPTRPEQADLFVALHGSHGDSPRIVLAATGVGDCYALAQRAFELAEQLQTPVVVLLDQYIAQSEQTVADLGMVVREPAQHGIDAPDPSANGHAPGEDETASPYRRYAVTESGVSPLSVPGQRGGEFVAVGIEHDELGDPSGSAKMHQAQTAKRFRKLELAAAEALILRTGSDMPTLGLLTWGGSYEACAQAAEVLTAAGLPTQALAPQMLFPLPVAELQQWVDGLEHLVVAEVNYAGQFYRHLRGYVDLPRNVRSLTRAGGTPLNAAEVLSFVERVGTLLAASESLIDSSTADAAGCVPTDK